MSRPRPTLLDVADLTVSYRLGDNWLPALRDFRLRLGAGEVLGLVGESGSGKSTAALALLRCLDSKGRIESGARLRYRGEDLLGKSPKEMRRIWARRVKLVPQNAGAALNPSIRVGAQVLEALRAADGRTGDPARAAMLQLFRDVSLADPEGVARRYPQELSGGMQQRVIIAMALICKPELLILDEPTTGLDATTEAVILDLTRRLIAERETSVLYISHNLGAVAQLCQRVIVLYAGEIMEEAEAETLFRNPRHPYTQGLLKSLPWPGASKLEAPLQAIGGNPPVLSRQPRGCVFAERCPHVVELCREVKPMLERLPRGGLARCHRWEELEQATHPASQSRLESPGGEATADSAPRPGGHGETVMRATDMAKQFPVERSLADWLAGRRAPPVRAVEGVDLRLHRGRTLGVVGESGSGKTTLARLLIGLEDGAGQLELLGAELPQNLSQRPAATLAQIQLVFQNPQNSLNPYISVGGAIRRPLMKLRGLSRAAADREALKLLERVNLSAEYARRLPGELSGGEKQRVAIARAFASQPEIVICDEPVSALDVSVQAAVLNLLAELQRAQGSACLFISHDLAVVGYLADAVAVMHLGQFVEFVEARSLFQPPFHPYTEALVSAIPQPDPRRTSAPVLLHEELSSAQARPGGCRFHTRCPRVVGEICQRDEPPWRETSAGQRIRCHIPLDDLRALQSPPVD